MAKINSCYNKGVTGGNNGISYTAQVNEYYNANNVDFFITAHNEATDSDFRFYVQPKVIDNEVNDLSTPDSQDDVIFLPTDDVEVSTFIELLQEALYEYLDKSA